MLKSSTSETIFRLGYALCAYWNLNVVEHVWRRQSLQLNTVFLFLNQNICCGYLKEQSQYDGSFEHPKLKLKLIDKKILRSKNLFI